MSGWPRSCYVLALTCTCCLVAWFLPYTCPGAILGFLSLFALVGLNIAFVVYLMQGREPIPWPRQ
eukprot:COSAG05_NODE_2873_length_2554_cov_1.866802_2_plen_65_part_00